MCVSVYSLRRKICLNSIIQFYEEVALKFVRIHSGLGKIST